MKRWTWEEIGDLSPQQVALALNKLERFKERHSKQERNRLRQPDSEGCINCRADLGPVDIRGFYGHPDVGAGAVGPLCEQCYDTIQIHKGPPATTAHGEGIASGWQSIEDLQALAQRIEAAANTPLRWMDGCPNRYEVSAWLSELRRITGRLMLLPDPPGAITEPSEVEEMRARKDAAYDERNRMVAVLSKLWPSHLARHPESDTTWERDWMTIVCIHSPMGQLTWHMHDDHRPMFAHLAMGEGHWDGHTTEQKYQRLNAFAPPGAEESALTAGEGLRVAVESILSQLEFPIGLGYNGSVTADLRDALADYQRAKAGPVSLSPAGGETK